MINLTRVQMETYNAIAQFINENHRPPSRRELAKAMGKGRSTVQQAIEKLCELGAVERQMYTGASLRLNDLHLNQYELLDTETYSKGPSDVYRSQPRRVRGV